MVLTLLWKQRLVEVFVFACFFTNGMITFVVFISKSLGILPKFVHTESFGVHQHDRWLEVGASGQVFAPANAKTE